LTRRRRAWFERWWGGFFRMTGAEIEAITENLFVGNKLARGELEVKGRPVNLRDITAPIVVFASWGTTSRRRRRH
jgi:poly(3-hydroxyalkanoate) synthetase